jgi:U3 small nucleolar RNA-associated protein 21
MASTNIAGDYALWNLETRRLFHLERGAHDGAIHSCYFYPNQPLLVTASADNSLKMWIFDSLDGIPRLLKSRVGHFKPPQRVKHYSVDGKILLSAGRDQTLRMISMIQDSQNTELSQGSLIKKSKKLHISVEKLRFSNIIDFDCCETRAKDWDNIVTFHQDENIAHSWSLQKKAVGAHKFATSDGSPCKVII